LLVARNEALEAVFVADVEADQDRRCETRGQPEDGDARVKPIAPDVTKRNRQIVPEHGRLLQ
jgi:hypothetical protein